MRTKRRERSLLVRVLAVLLSFAFALSGVPVTAIAEAEAEAEAFAQQEQLLEGNDLETDGEGEVTNAEDDFLDTEDEGDFGPVDEDAVDATDETVTVEDFAAQVAENAGEDAGEAALAEAAYDLMVAAVMPVGDAEDVAAGDVLAGRPADALSIARALRDVLAQLGLEADVLVADADEALAWTVVRVDGAWLHLDVAQGAREIGDDEAEPWRLLTDDELLARDEARSPWHALDGVWEPAVDEETAQEPSLEEPSSESNSSITDDDTEYENDVEAQQSGQRTAGVLREVNPSDDEVEAQGTVVYFNVYSNGAMKIETTRPSSSCTHSWNIDADAYYYDASVTDNTPWRNYSSEITSISVTATGLEVRNAKQMFQGMSSLTSASIGNLDTSLCTSMYEIFDSCTALQSVNANGLNTASVTDMSWIFWNDSALKTVNIASWDTRAVTSCSGPFNYCDSLTSITVGKNFNFTNYSSGINFPSNPSRSDGRWWSSADGAWIYNTSIGSRSKATTYTRTKTATRDISKSTCKASIKTQAWTGKQIKPTPTVKWGSATLKKGTHFKIVKYGTNKNNGTKGNWVKIQGIGSYKGTRTVKFRIRKPNVLYYVHRQTYGWEKKYSKKNGQQSGTTGQAKRLEGIYIKLSNKPVTGSIKYRTHVQKIGWQGWKSAGKMSGTSGKALRLEAIQIKLTGNMAKKYDVWYRVHAQHFGWMGWAKNGAKSGTAGYAYRLESIQIVLKPKGSKAPPANFLGARRATTAVFKDKNTLKYKFKRDTWYFNNYSTTIPLSYHTRMFGNSRGTQLYYDTNYGQANGVCYGFATSVAAMVKHGYPKVRSFGSSSIHGIDKYDYTSSLNLYAVSYIEYCYLTQYDYRLLNEMYRTRNNYAGLVNAVKKHQYNGTAIEIDLMGNGGHSVFPLKISSNTSSKTVIDIYDSNRPDTVQKLTLWKSGGRYTGFSYPYGGFTWLAWETPADNVKSFMAGNGIYKGDAAGDMNLISTDTNLTVVSGGKEYRLSPDNTSDLDMVVPVLSKGGTTTKQLYWVGFDTSDMVVKDLSKNAKFSVAIESGSVEVSAKKGSTVHMQVSDTAKNSVSIDGKKGDAFQVTYREDNGKDLDEYEVKGTATGKVVETTLEDNGKVDVKGGTLK